MGPDKAGRKLAGKWLSLRIVLLALGLAVGLAVLLVLIALLWQVVLFLAHAASG